MRKRGRNLRQEHIITCIFIFLIIGLAIGILQFINLKITGLAVYEGPGEGQTTLMLQEAETENLMDAHVISAGDADKNFGGSTLLKSGNTIRTYLSFNISGIPQNQKVEESKLCLYVANTKKTQKINASHVYSSWSESILTWNNQPCGVGFDDSGNCNLTAESFVQMTSGISYAWLCWDVTNMVSKDYALGKENNSIVLHTSDLNINDFYSKEYSDASLRPYLNITYSSSDINPPSLNMTFPEENGVYGYNESINLNYSVSDSESNLESCWYNLDSEQNQSLTCGQNATFGTSDGSHTIYLFANDSIGNENSTNVNFTINLGPPIINLDYPSDNFFINYLEIYFNYTPVDINLESCRLFGDFDGEFKINQTSSSPISNQINQFNLILWDGTYSWAIWCNDSGGDSAISNNYTLNIDTVIPSISLFEPAGEKSSRTIPVSWDASDANIESCWYNVYRGENMEVMNTSVSCGSDSSSFDVTVDADFILNFYVSDSAGNLNSTNSSFGVDTSTSPPPSNDGSSSGGSGSYAPQITGLRKLEVDSIANLIVNTKNIKKIDWSVKNAGTTFLNDCKFASSGEFASWIDYTETKDLSAGERYEILFDLVIPEKTESGVYNLTVSLKCREAEESARFIVEIIEQKIGFNLITVERVEKEGVKIVYILEELHGIDQNVELQFLLFGSNNDKVAEIKENKKISQNSKERFDILIPIEPSLSGELNLLINMNSETYSAFIQENIILGAPVSGFAVLGKTGTADNMLSIVFIILFLIFTFFMVRRIRTLKKK